MPSKYKFTQKKDLTCDKSFYWNGDRKKMAEEIHMYRKEAYREYEILKYRRLEVKNRRREIRKNWKAWRCYHLRDKKLKNIDRKRERQREREREREVEGGKCVCVWERKSV